MQKRETIPQTVSTFRFRRTFEQFDTQVFHRASLSGGFVLQQVRDKKPAKS